MEIDADPTVVAARPSGGGLPPSRTVEGQPLQVAVDERGLERAIRKLKRKSDAEGVTRELKRRRHYEKPSERKRRKQRDAERRRRRAARRMVRKPMEPRMHP